MIWVWFIYMIYLCILIMALRLKCTDTVGHRPAKLKLSLSCKTARYFINPSLPWWTVPHLHINGTQGIFEANTRWVTGEEIRFQFIKATGLPEKLQLHDAKTTDFRQECFDRWIHLQKKAGRESCTSTRKQAIWFQSCSAKNHQRL